MKKLLLLLLLLPLAHNSDAQTVLSHSESETIQSGNSISCSSGGIIQASYLHRRFDLDDFNIVDTAFIINMRYGVESSPDGPYKVRSRVYTLDDPVFTIGNMSYIIGDTQDTYVDSTEYWLETDWPTGYYALPGDTLIGEIYCPTDFVAGFWLGSNSFPETDSSFMMATGCALPVPTTLANVGTGFPGCHWLMKIYVNQRPSLATVNEWLWKDDTLDFTKFEFHSGLTDPDFDDTLSMIRIKSLPSNGMLEFMSGPVAIDDTIMMNQITDLQYIPDAGYFGLDTFMIIGKDNYHWTLVDSPVEINVMNFMASIDENEPEWGIYPNPAEENILINGFDQLEGVQIFDIGGQLVHRLAIQTNQVDVSFLPTGSYILEVTTELGTFSKQFVKK